jgi:3-oxoacyl-[acyl-carrier-protein] synthase-3
MSGVGIVGIGLYLPPHLVHNAEIAARCGASESWIVSKTGVLSRRRAAPAQTVRDLAVAAASDAIAESGIQPDLLVLATSVPDRPMPPMAPSVQNALNLPPLGALDLNAACAGFVHGLAMAWGATRVGLCAHPLVVGADVLSRYVDPGDPRTAALFGDGAGACVLGPVPDGYGILSTKLWADGSLSELVRIELDSEWCEGHSIPPAKYFEMDGRRAIEGVMRIVPQVLDCCLKEARLSARDLDRLIVHQANVRFVDSLRVAMGLGADKVPTSGRTIGNAGAASVPVGLAVSHRERALGRDEIVALVTVGAGACVAASVLRWY